MTYITAEEARNAVLNGGGRNERLKNFFDKVEYEVYENGSTEFNYYINQDNDFTKAELSFIRSLGYNIYWDSPCLWYEVSF